VHKMVDLNVLSVLRKKGYKLRRQVLSTLVSLFQIEPWVLAGARRRLIARSA